MGPTLVYLDVASGANGAYTRRLVQGLLAEGAEVTCICPWRDADYEHLADLPVAFLGAPPIGRFARLPETFARVRRFAGAWGRASRDVRVVIAISNHVDALLLGLVLTLRPPLRGRTFVVHDPVPHRWFLPISLRRFEQRLVHVAWRRFDTLVTHTAEGARLAAQSAPNAVVLRVDLPPLGDVRVRSSREARCGISLVGTLRPDKDYLGVVEAYQQLPMHVRESHPLLIAGRAQRGYDMGVLQRMIEQDPTGIEMRLGFMSRDKLEQVLLDSAACVLPYRGAASASGIAEDARLVGCPLLAPTDGSLVGLVEIGAAEPWPSALSDRSAALARVVERGADSTSGFSLGEIERRARVLAFASWGVPADSR